PSGERAGGQNRCAELLQCSVGDGKGATIGEIQIDAGEGAFPVEVSVAPINLDGQRRNIAILRDISERKDAEQALRDNESLLRTLINAMPDFVCFKDGDGRWLMANEFGLRLFGIENIDYRNQSDAELSEYNDFFRPAFLACIESDEESWQCGNVTRCDEMVPRMEGEPFTFDVIKVPLFHPDGSRKGLVVIGRDITARKNIEKALQDSEEQLRYLSASLFVVQETERRRIANELHDELGQALVALKMQVRAMQRHLGTDRSDESRECDEICDYVNEIIENVRRLSRDLSPVVLDDLGLGAALKHMVDGFSELHDIDGSIIIDEIGHLLSSGAERIVYRIVQEALTNIAKHANAKSVEVSVHKKGRDILFQIKDDGKGFDTEAVAQKKAVERGLGLTAMSERVRMLGGALDIESSPGHGTSIKFSVSVQGG
ncbi:MAG: PAS domain S-box protein, partial [Desulfobulbaceae bacterium]|nr:PAS domain S-box protein [Desulfobulbaceae bacterium]